MYFEILYKLFYSKLTMEKERYPILFYGGYSEMIIEYKRIYYYLMQGCKEKIDITQKKNLKLYQPVKPRKMFKKNFEECSAVPLKPWSFGKERYSILINGLLLA